MKTVFGNIKGDRIIWSIAALLAIFSFLPVYSAASNLAYMGSGSNTFSYFIKHFVHLFLGFSIIYGVHKIPYRYFRGLSMVMIPVVLILLMITILQGATIEGANASRWIRVPIVGFAFQPSTLATLVLMVYVARYLTKIKDKIISIKGSILPLWLPVFIVLALILPANFSTAAIIFSMVVLLTYVGGYPLKYLSIIIGSGVVVLALFVLTAKAFPNLIPNRVDTWTSRISSFIDSEVTREDYQIEKAKIAIATGGVKGLGPGKSVQKNFLPQSSSDFIFAIIIEEYGMVGGFIILGLYLFLLIRIIVIANGAPTFFAKLIALGVGLPIVFQAFINMGVAVSLLPVTGQTLPLISSGGTSIWMTCLALGILLSASNKSAQTAPATVTEETTNPLEILSEQL